MTRFLIAIALLVSASTAHAQDYAYRLEHGIQSIPRASAPSKRTTYGSLWVNSTDSNKWWFTTPAGSSAAVGGSGSGTVTSVGMTVPSFLSVAGSPVTTSGTLALTLATQSANTVLAGPTSGGAATSAFRALVAADIPATAVSAGTCTSCDLTIDAAGRITAKANGSGGGSTGDYTFSANTIDLSGAATMSIAPTTATAITLGQDTTLAAGKTITAAHHAGSGSAPSCAVGAALGSGGSVGCTCTGTDTAMECVFVGGASGTGTGTMGTITYATTFSTKPYCVASAYSAATAASGAGYTMAVNRASSSATTLIFEAGGSVAGGATYGFDIVCFK